MEFMRNGYTTIRCAEKLATSGFRVTVVDEKLQIWLKDVDSKEEWQTRKLTTSEFLGTHNGIPHAGPVDYAKCFVECLNAHVDGAGGSFQREQSTTKKDGSRELTLWLGANVGSLSADFSYRFTLLPVVLDAVEVLSAQVCGLRHEKKHHEQLQVLEARIDALQSMLTNQIGHNEVLKIRLRDLEGKMKDQHELEARLGYLQDKMDNHIRRQDVLATLRACNEAPPSGVVQWKPETAFDDTEFELHNAGRGIELVRGGRYLISLHFAMGNTTMYGININGNTVRRISDNYAAQSHQTLAFVERVPAKATLKIVNLGTANAPTSSLLTIAAV